MASVGRMAATQILILLLGAGFSLGVLAKDESTTTYDGRWWLSVTPEEQYGYVAGDSDCYRSELTRKAHYSKSIKEEQAFVTEYYANKPTRRGLAVFEVARLSGITPPKVKPLPPEKGETWNEPHGYFDGEWWREASPAERLGFVEGYMACYLKSQERHGSLSGAPAQYVQSIGQWYKLDDEAGGVDPVRANAKIADVLFMFSDHPERSASSSK